MQKIVPIQIGGDPTEKREVSNYKDLPRVESDFIRGGFCLDNGEGLAQKAQEGISVFLQGIQKNGIENRLIGNGWKNMLNYMKKEMKGKTDSSPTYIKDLVAGKTCFWTSWKGIEISIWEK